MKLPIKFLIRRNYILLSGFLGGLFGYLILHPYSMIIYHYLHHGNEFSGVLQLFRIFLESFNPAMFKMGFLYIVFGSAVGVVIAIQQKKIFAQYVTIRRRNEELKAINHRKDEFLALISHDLRTPLTSIIGYAEILKRENAFTQFHQKEYNEVILQSADYLRKLIDELLNLAGAESSKNENLEYEEFDFRKLLEHSLEEMKFHIDTKGIRIEHYSILNSIAIEADRLKMFQVINNLISNAIKFSDKGGLVILFTEQEDNRLIFKVVNDGPQIPTNKLKTIFDKFERGSKKDGGGFGLGLFIARKIIELHGGRIWAKNRNSRGVEVVFEIPLTPSPTLQKKTFAAQKFFTVPSRSSY